MDLQSAKKKQAELLSMVILGNDIKQSQDVKSGSQWLRVFALMDMLFRYFQSRNPFNSMDSHEHSRQLEVSLQHKRMDKRLTWIGLA